MASMVQKFIVEDASKASPIMPQRVAFVDPEGNPLSLGAKVAKNPGASPTVAKVVSALVEAGLMEPADGE